MHVHSQVSSRTWYQAVGMLAIGLLILGFLAGCGAGQESPRLRITNSGSEPIEDLVVLFPEEEIAFGDVAPGETTGYLEAADQLPLDDQEVLLDVLHRRVVAQRRKELVAEVREAREEYREAILLETVGTQYHLNNSG